jgi:hypothetical protein
MYVILQDVGARQIKIGILRCVSHGMPQRKSRVTLVLSFPIPSSFVLLLLHTHLSLYIDYGLEQ